MPAAHGGLGMSTPVVALLWGLGVVGSVVYLAVTHEPITERP